MKGLGLPEWIAAEAKSWWAEYRSAALFALTEGNPLFLRESLHVVAGSSSAPIEALRDVTAAGGVLSIVRSRLAGADDGLRSLLDVAAVFESLDMISARFLEHARCSPLLTRRGVRHYTRRAMTRAEPNDAEPSEAPLPADAIAKLVANHRDFLSFLEQRVDSRAEAEDILQEAFVKGVERLGGLREGESANAWFYRVLRNAVVDHYRRRGSAGRALDAFAQELEREVEPALEVRQAVCACVRRLSETLKPEYAEALQRIEVDGLSVTGYAAELGIQANNAGVRVHRAREALRRRVMECCGSCAEHGCLNCTCRSAPGTGPASPG